MWIVPNFAMRQNVRRVRGYDDLNRVDAALHLHVAEIEALRQLDTAGLVEVNLILDTRHEDLTDVAVVVGDDLFCDFAKGEPPAVEDGHELRGPHAIHRREHQGTLYVSDRFVIELAEVLCAECGLSEKI